jgi:hypothetical protein
MVRPRHLKLRARDLDDMAVMAAMLQDAVVRPAEMTYQAREKRFVMVISRFRWEDPEVKPDPEGEEASGGASQAPEFEMESQADAQAGTQMDSQEDARFEDARFEDAGPRPLYERVNAGLCIENVRGVRTQKLDLRNKDQVLSLLTVEVRPRALTLVFSGGALVRLEVSSIACFLEDLGEPWATPWLPLHETEERDVSAADTAESGASE